MGCILTSVADQKPFPSELAAFLDHIRVERGLSPNSVEAYRRTWKSSSGAAQSSGGSGARRRARLSDAGARGRASPATAGRRLVAIRTLYRFLLMERLATSDPTENVAPPGPSSAFLLP